MADEEAAKSEMQYWPRIETDTSMVGPFITFDIFAPSSNYGELVTNVRSGLVPEKLDVKLAEDQKLWRSVDPANRWSKKVWRNEIADARG